MTTANFKKCFSDLFESLFKDEKVFPETDFTIITSDKKIQVHKFILILRSKYFHSLFSLNSEIEELSKNQLNKKNISYSVFKEVIFFF